MPNARKFIVLSILVAAGLIGLLIWGSDRDTRPRKTAGAKENPTTSTATNESTPQQSGPQAIFVYCAAGLKPPMEAVAKQYEAEYHTRIEIQYGGSGTLLNNLRVAGKGDLFLAADRDYIDLAIGQKLIDETIPVARQHPVLAVAKGNPKKVRGLADLAREDLRPVLANPDAASIGKVGRTILEKQKLWTQVEEAATKRGVFKPTVNEVANDLKLKTADAGIVWDATLPLYPELEALPIEGAGDFDLPVTVGVLRSAADPGAALHFARWLSATDKGLAIFKQMGYTPADGDAWDDRPEIVYFSGAVNRVAIQDTLKAFQEREGVRITTVFNGCGLLLGEMKLGARPDVYHTCDASFMKGVEELFGEAVPVSEMEIVILAKQGNPAGIRSLADLGKPGLKVALGNEKQSSLGWLTAELLREAGVYDAVQKNVIQTTPTGDMLVNQMRTGSLDAVVVYRSNTLVAAKTLDVIPLGMRGATAVQTFAIAKNSRHKQLIGRLFEALRRAESVKHYQECGFKWLVQ